MCVRVWVCVCVREAKRARRRISYSSIYPRCSAIKVRRDPVTSYIIVKTYREYQLRVKSSLYQSGPSPRGLSHTSIGPFRRTCISINPAACYNQTLNGRLDEPLSSAELSAGETRAARRTYNCRSGRQRPTVSRVTGARSDPFTDLFLVTTKVTISLITARRTFSENRLRDLS